MKQSTVGPPLTGVSRARRIREVDPEPVGQERDKVSISRDATVEVDDVDDAIELGTTLVGSSTLSGGPEV